MKYVVLLSGGVDSTTCLALALQEAGPADIIAVNAYYGQKHAREMASARKVAEHYGVEFMELDLSAVFEKSDCCLLKGAAGEIPHSSYADQQKEEGGIVKTYVPFRNGLMLSAAASIAVSVGAEAVYYGAHADDAAGNAYPDCSEQFIEAMEQAILEGTGGKVGLMAPFAALNKAQVVEIGLSLGVPYELTWSCYEGGEKPCGKCGTCIDRAKAFEINGVADPAL